MRHALDVELSTIDEERAKDVGARYGQSFLRRLEAAHRTIPLPSLQQMAKQQLRDARVGVLRSTPYESASFVVTPACVEAFISAVRDECPNLVVTELRQQPTHLTYTHHDLVELRDAARFDFPFHAHLGLTPDQGALLAKKIRSCRDFLDLEALRPFPTLAKKAAILFAAQQYSRMCDSFTAEAIERLRGAVRQGFPLAAYFSPEAVPAVTRALAYAYHDGTRPTASALVQVSGFTHIKEQMDLIEGVDFHLALCERLTPGRISILRHAIAKGFPLESMMPADRAQEMAHRYIANTAMLSSQDVVRDFRLPSIEAYDHLMAAASTFMRVRQSMLPEHLAAVRDAIERGFDVTVAAPTLSPEQANKVSASYRDPNVRKVPGDLAADFHLTSSQQSHRFLEAVTAYQHLSQRLGDDHFETLRSALAQGFDASTVVRVSASTARILARAYGTPATKKTPADIARDFRLASYRDAENLMQGARAFNSLTRYLSPARIATFREAVSSGFLRLPAISPFVPAHVESVERAYADLTIPKTAGDVLRDFRLRSADDCTRLMGAAHDFVEIRALMRPAHLDTIRRATASGFSLAPFCGAEPAQRIHARIADIDTPAGLSSVLGLCDTKVFSSMVDAARSHLAEMRPLEEVPLAPTGGMSMRL